MFAAALLPMVGCSTYRDVTATQAQIDQYSALDYPRNAPYGPKLDIQVVRSNGDIRLNNRTASPYRGMTLWLNQQYAGDAGHLVIGTENVRVLTDYINRHREPYPVGTVLNPDKTAVLVLAELYNPAEGVRHRLVIRPGNESSIMPFEVLD